MLNPALKSKVRVLWDSFFSSGVSNPLESIEQISYLILLRHVEVLDKYEATRAKRQAQKFVSRFHGYEECRWSSIRKLPPEDMLAVVRDKAFPLLKSPKVLGKTFEAAMKDAVFTISRPSLLANVVRAIHELGLGDMKPHIQGDLYEELLMLLSQSHRTGQVRTPHHITRTIVEMIAPEPGESVCDPAAGTAGFLIAAYQWVLKTHVPSEVARQDPEDMLSRWRTALDGRLFAGYDIDATMVRLGLVNMLLHGIRQPNLRCQDVLSANFVPTPRKINVILTNPPAVGSVERSRLHPRLLKVQTNRIELPFIEMCLTLLSQGGRGAIIVPEEVLFGSSDAHKALRRQLIEHNRLEAIVSLPSGCFRPFTGIKAAILFLTKGGKTNQVWFYEVTKDGYTLDDRRLPDPDDDLRFVPQAFRIQVRGAEEKWPSKEAQSLVEQRSWCVVRQEIAAHDYTLAPTVYRPATGEEQQDDDPLQIIERVRSTERQISRRLTRMKKLIQEMVHE